MAARHNRTLMVGIKETQLKFHKTTSFVSTTTYLWGVSVVEHAEDNSGHGVLRVRHVSRRGEGWQVVLQGLTQHAVKSYVRAEDVALLPAVFL